MSDPSTSPQAAVYAAHLSALAEADLDALRATVSRQLAEQIADPAFAARLEVLASLVPDDPRVTGLREEGERATLELETDGLAGTVILVLEEGAWKVAGQGWKARS